MTLAGKTLSGTTILVDDQGAALLASSSWYSAGDEGRYIGRPVERDGKRTTEYLHRIIANAPACVEVDHINGDPRDNRRCNLRLVTRSENERAKFRARVDSKTRVRGVSFHSDRNSCYRAYVWGEGKRVTLGYFKTLEEAATVAATRRAELLAHLRPIGLLP